MLKFLLNTAEKKTLVVFDLDNTLVDTESLLKQKGLLPKDKSLYENDIDDVVDAYIAVGTSLLEAKPIEPTVRFAKLLHRRGLDVVVVTSRLSIPVDITKRQVAKILGPDVPIFVSDRKDLTINSLVRTGGYSLVVIVDDKYSGYKEVYAPTLLYTHPNEVLAGEESR